MAVGLNIGHLPVSSAYVGGNALSKIYLGIVEVFSGGWSPSELFAAGEQGVWYDPSDGAFNWRYNLLTYTEQFDNAAWVKATCSVTPNSTVAPDGTTTADTLVSTSTTSRAEVSVTVTTSTQYTYSVYAKAGNTGWLMVSLVLFTTPGNVNVWFNLATGTVGTVGTGLSAAIEQAANGFYRCSVTFTTDTVDTTGTLRNNIVVNNGQTTCAVNDTLIIWGASLTTAADASRPYQKITDGVADYYTYDPDPVLFQDSAGTTPVTAIEQPVGLILDKSKGLVLGPELVTNGDFSNGTTGWTESAVGALSVSGGEATVTNITAGSKYAYQAFSTVVGKIYVVTFNVTNVGGGTITCRIGAGNTVSNEGAGVGTFGVGAGQLVIYPAGTTTYIRFGPQGTGLNFFATCDNISIKELAGNHAFQPTTTSRSILRNRYNQLVQTATLSTQNVTTRATSHKLSFSGAGTITLSGTATGTFSAGTNTFTATAGTLTLTVSGTVTEAMLTEANDGNVPYQWVTTGAQYTGSPVTAGYDTDVTKFPPYLFFDGSDDWLSTANIDFSATDKVSVFAGIRRLTDGGIILELSASVSTTRTFAVFNGNGLSAAGSIYTMFSHGSAVINLNQGAQTPASYAAPRTNTLIGIGDISADRSYIYVNGSLIATATGEQGTGNFGTYPLYIGRRAGNQYPFNGRIYSLIIRGALTSSPQLEQTESWVNGKTGAY